jgi:hypothetical protein
MKKIPLKNILDYVKSSSSITCNSCCTAYTYNPRASEVLPYLRKVYIKEMEYYGQDFRNLENYLEDMLK